MVLKLQNWLHCLEHELINVDQNQVLASLHLDELITDMLILIPVCLLIEPKIKYVGVPPPTHLPLILILFWQKKAHPPPLFLQR